MNPRFRIALALLFLIFVIPTAAHAQRYWRDIGGGIHGSIPSIAVTGDGTILHGSFGSGIYQSNDGGESWWRGRFEDGPLDEPMPLAINSIAISDNGPEILAAMSSSIFRSTDGGDNWTRHRTEIDGPTGTLAIFALLRLGPGRVLVGTPSSFYRSTGDFDGFERLIHNDTARMTSQFLRSGPYIFAGTNVGLYRFLVDGTPDAIGLRQGMHARASINALAVTDQGVLLAGTDEGVYRSTDNGNTWSGQQLSTHLVKSLLVAPNGIIIVGTGGGLYRSTDNGATWNSSEGGLASNWIGALARTPDGTIVAGTGVGIHISSNNGESWRHTYAGLANSEPTSVLAIDSTRIFVLQRGGNTPPVRRSSNAGRSWTALEASISGPDLYHLVAAPDRSIIAGTLQGVYRSTTNGDTWRHVGLDSATNLVALGPGGRILASAWSAKSLHLSTDDGLTWKQINDGERYDVIAISPEGDLYAGSLFGLWRSKDNGANWDLMNINGDWTSSLVIDRLGYVYVGTELGISRSTDRGATWTFLENSPRDAMTGKLVTNRFGHIFALLTNGPKSGINRSTDQGRTWELLPHEYGYVSVPELSIDADGYLYGIIRQRGVAYLMRSERALAPGIRRPISPEDASIILATDPTFQWEPVTGATGYHLQLSSDPLFGQRTTGSTDGILSGLVPIIDDSTLSAASRGVTGLVPGTTYYWRVRSRLAEGWDLWSPLFSFTVESSSSVDREERSGRMAGATIELPAPHPISGRAVVGFTVAQTGEIRLTLHDTFGRELSTIAEGLRSAGEHQVEIDASGLASGAYVLTITGAGGRSSRMIIAR